MFLNYRIKFLLLSVNTVHHFRTITGLPPDRQRVKYLVCFMEILYRRLCHQSGTEAYVCMNRQSETLPVGTFKDKRKDTRGGLRMCVCVCKCAAFKLYT